MTWEQHHQDRQSEKRRKLRADGLCRCGECATHGALCGPCYRIDRIKRAVRRQEAQTGRKIIELQRYHYEQRKDRGWCLACGMPDGYLLCEDCEGKVVRLRR